MYRNCFKRIFDFLLSLTALLLLSPLLLVLALVGAIVMKGNPFFTQVRPGKDERLFRLVKFRTMTCETDADGNPLPDDRRLVPYGRFLRATSLDELPELWNILKGDMAIIGPRPLLVRDMVFMTPEQRRRHTVRQGLTGLAQVSGRNAISWENKLSYDLLYLRNITFWGDCRILFKTILAVFCSEGITEAGMATAADFGDYLLAQNKISRQGYDANMQYAQKLLDEFAGK